MWILLSFLTAFCEAAKDGLCKKGLQSMDSATVSWAWKVFSLPFLLPAALFLSMPEQLPAEFWLALVVGGGLNVAATLLYIKAIQLSDLSLTLPLLSLTPVFLLFTSPLLVGDIPSPAGYLGVILIFLGTYLLGLSRSTGFWTPFKALLQDQGARLMFLVALIWSIAANMDKIGVQASNVFFWAASVQVFISLGLSLTLLLNIQGKKQQISVHLLLLLLIGLVTAAGFIFQMSAISIGLVPYIIAIKRTSIVLGVAIGGFFFQEKDLPAPGLHPDHAPGRLLDSVFPVI